MPRWKGKNASDELRLCVSYQPGHDASWRVGYQDSGPDPIKGGSTYILHRPLLMDRTDDGLDVGDIEGVEPRIPITPAPGHCV